MLPHTVGWLAADQGQGPQKVWRSMQRVQSGPGCGCRTRFWCERQCARAVARGVARGGACVGARVCFVALMIDNEAYHL